MRLKIVKSKSSESFSIIEDYINPTTKKRTTTTIESLGNLNSWMKKLDTSSRDVVIAHLQNLIRQKSEAVKAESADVLLTLSQTREIPQGRKVCFNVGYLFIQSILYQLGLESICKEIEEKHQFKYSLSDILANEVTSRIICPCSKRSTAANRARFLEDPSYDLQHVYRALPILAEEHDEIEKKLYKNTERLIEYDTDVLYYDCTNFYFEIEEEDDFRKYGKSKENRPNPIVQYGLFLDQNSIPLCDIAFTGSENEQLSMRKLEKTLIEKFGKKRLIVCADAGLNGWDNKMLNNNEFRAYIVVKPIKMMKKSLRDWALDPDGWYLVEQPNVRYNLNELGETTIVNGEKRKTSDLIFYKDRWTKETKKDKETKEPKTLEEHLIVSFNTGFKKYKKHIRDKKLERAAKLLKNPGKIAKSKNQRDPRYYIQACATTENGEVADEVWYELNEERIREEEAMDGFYAVTTNLEDNDIAEVLKVNKGRWEIEECFEVMKSELKTRPVYVRREEAIKGHLLICFIALKVYRILEKMLGCEYTINETIRTLRDMQVTHVQSKYYVPSFERTELVDKLQDLFGFKLTTEVISEQKINLFLRKSKQEIVRKNKSKIKG